MNNKNKNTLENEDSSSLSNLSSYDDSGIYFNLRWK